MITELKKKLGIIKNNIGGWSTSRKILVIESDDWGSIRIPSKNAFDILKNKGIPVNECPFLSLDHFEQIDDFNALFQVMLEIKQKYNKSPKITANYIMANPDFKSIKDFNFKNYSYISLKNKLQSENVLSDYMQQIDRGQKENWFQPQLHGREHLNIGLWMRLLEESSKETLLAFDNEVYGISTTISSEKRRSYLPALDYENEAIFKKFVIPSLFESQQLFKDFFGFVSKSFIAPNYTWDSKIEAILAEQKIEFIQGSRSQLVSIGAQKKEGKVIKRKTGERNKNSQVYLVRNAIFEPSTVKNKQKHLNDCLSQINLSFICRKPAILSMHRLNFMGGLNLSNREENLSLFKKLIETLIVKHPNIEFMSSDQLGNNIKQTKYD
jgi:hypothetical protein